MSGMGQRRRWSAAVRGSALPQQADDPPLQISHLLSAYNQTTGYDPAYLSGAKQGQYIVPFQKRWRVQLLDHGAQP